MLPAWETYLTVKLPGAGTYIVSLPAGQKFIGLGSAYLRRPLFRI